MNLVKMILAVFILSISNSSLFQIVSASPLNQEVFACGESFESYAYGLPGYEISPADEPNDQWQARYEIPRRIIHDIEVGYRNPRVLFSRLVNNHQEIWIELDLRGYQRDLNYSVYNTDTGGFELISADIANLNLVADQLFVDFDGIVWGIVEQSANENDNYTNETGYYPNVSEFFPLAYFDESEQQFKLAIGEPKLAIQKDELRFSSETVVVVDHGRRVFWLFYDTAIYRYDPVTQSPTLIYSFSENGFIVSAGIASNGDIYFIRGRPRELSEMISNHVDSLFVLTSETNSVQQINDPPRSIPKARNLFLDHVDNLWLDAIAYREEVSGLWVILHPDPDFGLELNNFISLFGWEYPEIVLEDSSGRIWFSGDNEYPYGASGLAWYDPTTGHGCNNILNSTNIIEDVDGNLWFFDQGTRLLYQTVDSVASFNVSLASLEEDTHDPQ